MTVSRPALVAFNRGIISPRALARVDLKRSQLSAEIQKNWMPRTLGSMMLRPGLGYQGQTDNERAWFLPMIRAAEETNLLEFTNGKLRVWSIDTDMREASLVTRVSVSAAVTNGNFTTDVSGWTDASEAGASTTWDSGNGGQAQLLGTGQNRAILYQTVTLGAGDSGKRHALRITVNRGKPRIRVGSTTTGDDYINETTIGPGIHSLAFSPTTDFTVQLSSDADYKVFIGDCNIEAAGVMAIVVPYVGADLPLLRWGESVDVLYLACEGYAQKKVERRADDSWSFVEYFSEDGPFNVENTTPTSIAVSAIKGDVTLTASRALFYAGHVGALFRIRSIGQLVEDTVAGDDQWTDPVEVSGIGQARNITVNSTGTWVGTLRLQRSVGAIGVWEDVAGETTAGNWTNHVFNDTFDNDLIFYRAGFKSGDYTSGSADVTLQISGGGINGIVRITDVASSFSASAVVLKTLGGTLASDTWWEGIWSTLRGFPSAVAEPYEGRLCWAGKGWSVQSVSDAYESFDDTIEGDSGPIIRQIGFGPLDTMGWILGLQRLLMGGDSNVYSIRSSSLDEPLTPSNWNVKAAATQGSAHVPSVRMDSDGLYIQISKTRLFRLSFDPQGGYFSGLDYSATDLTRIAPELGKPQFIRIAVQRMPDTRIHCVRADGTAAVLVFDPLEEVQAWVEVETDGCIEDVVILPGIEEDLVFYEVLRQPGTDSATHCLELWAMEDECRGPYSDDPDLNKQADCFTVFDVGAGAPTTVIDGLPGFLVGKPLVCWGDGKDLGGPARTTFTAVTDGAGGAQITVPVEVSRAIAGLYYQATYKSTKQAYGGMNGETALTMRKQIKWLGVVSGVMHSQGLKYGPDFASLDDLPQVEDGAVTDFDYVWAAYDKDPIEFPGEMLTDSRICLLAQAPRPCELLGLVPSIDTADTV